MNNLLDEMGRYQRDEQESQQMLDKEFYNIDDQISGLLSAI